MIEVVSSVTDCLASLAFEAGKGQFDNSICNGIIILGFFEY